MITPLVESDGSTSGFVAVIRDVTYEHQRHLQLPGEALTDSLTGPSNRHGPALRASQTAAETATPCAPPPGSERPARGE